MQTETLDIQYDFAASSLGLVLVAITKDGICQITVDDDKESQVEHLHKNFPKAKIEQNDEALAEILPLVTAFIEHPTKTFPSPLDLHGTPFQKIVWKALLGILPGETLTYTQLANRINKPDAVRAVAGACGANKIAVIVPCHRIIRADGGLGGYRWGLERKQTLLAREAQQNQFNS